MHYGADTEKVSGTEAPRRATVSISLPLDALDALDRLAHAEKRTRSSQIAYLVEREVRRRPPS